jgi:hypothetical protein
MKRAKEGRRGWRKEGGGEAEPILACLSVGFTTVPSKRK